MLDAAVDPDADKRAHAEESAAAFEAGFDAFAANCTTLIAGCPLGDEPRQFVEALLAQAAQTPIPSHARSVRPDGGAAAPGRPPGVVMTAIQAALYDTASWPQLAQALAAAQQGDSARACSRSPTATPGGLEDGTYSNLLDANLAVNCADTDETFEEEEVRDLAAEWTAKYPLFGAGSAPSASTPARSGRPSARRCPSATPRAARRSSSSATPATR